MSDPNRVAEKAAKKAAKEEEIGQMTTGLVFQPWPKISRLNREIVITEKIDGTNAAIGIGPPAGSVTQVEAAGGFAHSYPTMGAGRVWAQSRTRIITPLNDNFGFAAWVEKHANALRDILGPGFHFGEWWGAGIQRTYGLTEKRFSLFNTAKWNEPSNAEGLAKLRGDGIMIDTVPVLYTGPWTGNYGYKNSETGEWLVLADEKDWPTLYVDYEAAETRIASFMERIFELGVQDATDLRPRLEKISRPINPRPRFAPNFILEWLARVGSQAAPGFMKPEGICVYHKASGSIFKATVEGDEKHKNEA